jgi:hypothetical protein
MRFTSLRVSAVLAIAMALGAVGFAPGRAVGLSLADFTCNGLEPTIVGETGKINGTGGPDVINAVGSDVTVYGNGGDDVICVANAAVAYAGSGNDYVNGIGPDGFPDVTGSATLVFGGSGADELWSASNLYGDSGDDELHLGANQFGGSGNDDLFPSGPALTCDGGSGTDTISGTCTVVLNVP